MGKYSKSGKNSRKKPQKRKGRGLTVFLLTLVVILVLAIGGMWFLTGPQPLANTLPEGVSIGQLRVSGMTREEAMAALEEAIAGDTQQDMVVQLNDRLLTFTAADAGVQISIGDAVEEAFRTGESVDLADHMTYNLDLIRQRLEEACGSLDAASRPGEITVAGEMPVLDTASEAFDPEAPCQTVTVTVGTPGSHVDVDALMAQVEAAYANGQYLVVAEITGGEPVDKSELASQLQALYEDSFQPVQDAYMNTQTYEVSHEVYGYDFDLPAALDQLEAAQPGESFTVEFTLNAPEVTHDSLAGNLFRDVLASYETKHTNNSNRNANLTLACAAINGKLLMPGEQFDYNTTLGKRTAEAGYKSADAYSGGKTVQTLGGGICQVSSTLYYCTLIADLQIDTRLAHSYTSSYMPLGMDATVSWGGPEFRFTNNTNYPIRIEAEVSGGYVRVKLLGTDEKDYYVKMEYEVLSNSYADTVTQEFTKDNKEGYRNGQVVQTAYNGCTVQSYKLKYNKETNELISREKEALSKYKKRDKIIAKIVDKLTEPTEAPAATNPPATQPPATEPPVTAPPATEAPTPTAPPQTEPPAPAPTEAPAPTPTEAPAAE